MPAIQDTYSVDVRNRYDTGCFPVSDDDSQEVENVDPLDQLRKLEEEKEKERIAKKQAKLKQAATKNNKKKNSFKKEVIIPKKETDVARKTERGGDARYPKKSEFAPRSNDDRQPPRRRNMRGNGRGGDSGDGGERRFNYYQRENNRVENVEGGEGRPERTDRYQTERFRGGRGGSFRGNRQFYRNDGRDNRGKREYERRSGNDKTGVRASDKRDGGGSHNWGNAETYFNEVNEVTEALDATSVANDNETKPDVDANNEDAAAAKEEEVQGEPEPVEMTLDEWRASQAVEQKKQQFNIRKPGEGENHDEWKNLKVLKKEALPEYEVENDDDHVEYRRQYTKTHVDLNIQFSEQLNKPRGGRGRFGSRGGGRGRGGRGRRGFNNNNKRFDKNTVSIPDVQNELEFPTLSAA